MTFSYTQIAQYLRCPRSYQYKYMLGWQERADRASLAFGRSFEKALEALFRKQDPGAELFQQWSAYREAQLDYGERDDWDSMLRQGIGLLERFAQDNRVHVRPQNLQKKLIKVLPRGNDFVAYVDAIGSLDGKRCLLEWKTTTARYAEEPAGLTALDLQLVSYSWISGISDVAIVAFLRKRQPEIQYLKASISDEQRREFGEIVDATVGQIESGQFLPRPGIRFPQNTCVSCAHLGLCLDKPELVQANLIRREGASDLDWLDGIDG